MTCTENDLPLRVVRASERHAFPSHGLLVIRPFCTMTFLSIGLLVHFPSAMRRRSTCSRHIRNVGVTVTVTLSKLGLLCIIDAVQQHIDTILMRFTTRNATRKRGICRVHLSVCLSIRLPRRCKLLSDFFCVRLIPQSHFKCPAPVSNSRRNRFIEGGGKYGVMGKFSDFQVNFPHVVVAA